MDHGMVDILNRPLEATLKMVYQLVDACSDELWLNREQQYWKHIFHAVIGIDCWFRHEGEEFCLPRFNDKDVTDDFNKDSKDYPTKAEMKAYIKKMTVKASDFIKNMENKDLLERCEIYNKLTKADVILMQIRHIQHHVGFCNGILRANNLETVKWTGYFE